MSEGHPFPLTRGEEAGKKPISIVRAAVRIAILIRHDDGLRCLFVRHPTKGLELPGGAVDPGETALQAVLRELREETGIELPANHPLSLLGTIPLLDHRQGNWLDILYRTRATPEQLFYQHAGELPTYWLRPEEIPTLVDRQISSFNAALMALDTITQ